MAAAGGIPCRGPHWLSTVAYVPLLLAAGWLLARPLTLLTPAWRADQVDLAALVLALLLLLATLPGRIRRLWESQAPWRALGLAIAPATGGRQARNASLQAAALLCGVTVLLLLSGAAAWTPRLTPTLMLEALLLGLGVGFAEELLFRGWLFGELGLRLSPQRALGLQAAIYALVHPWYRESGLAKLTLLGGLLLLGLILGLRKRTDRGSIWGAIMLHGVLVGGWFLVQKGLIVIVAGAPSWWIGPGAATDVNPLGGLVGWVGLVGLLSLILNQPVLAGSLADW